MYKRSIVLTVLLGLGILVSAQSMPAKPAPPQAGVNPVVEKYINDNEQKHVQELMDFVSIPCISSLPSHAADMTKAAQWLQTKLQSIGMDSVQVMQTDGNPVVFAQWNNAKGKPTVLLYGHYDVQPVQEALWTSAPFTPKLENGRIYGRGASDDKGSALTGIWAVEAMLKKIGKLPVNVKFLFEGEEETGSAHLGAFVAAHKDLLQADAAYSADAFQKSDTQGAMIMSVKGASTMEFSLKTANRDLHSGVFGGRLPNAAVAMANIVASLHTPDGKVAVPGFYDKVTPMTDEEKHMAATVAYDEQKELTAYGATAFTGEKGYTSQERAWYRPTLEICGMWSGYTADEGFLNIVPASAHCRIMCRLVTNQDPIEIMALIKKHINSQLPEGVSIAWKDIGGFGIAAAKAPGNTAAFKAAVAVLTQLYGTAPVLMGTGGSNAATSVLDKELGLPPYSFGFLQEDENFHSHNEFMRVSDLQKGQLAYCMLLNYIGNQKTK
jgi:acetylornithine deacetylase/succinyl-diaminopimelate desuccinylase-like protein